MAIGPRDYKITTREKLFSLARNECSFPTCSQIIAKEDRSDFTVNICHIEAAEIGGERYNPKMSDDERRSYENLILLCPIHHIETNDVSNYTVEVLKQMKINHHLKMDEKYSSNSLINTQQSHLIEVINKISSSDLFSDLDLINTANSFDIENKISYNSVKRYKPIIREYGAYSGKLTKLYTEIEEQGSIKKDVLLQNIKSLYLKAQAKILGEDYTIESIQESADNLIEEVEKGLWELIEKKSKELNENVFYEAINPSLSVILVDAFMRCKILEEPPKAENDN